MMREDEAPVRGRPLQGLLVSPAPANESGPPPAALGPAQPRVGIVLLNWNEPHYTIPCLESLAHLDYPAHQVVVVDNGSRDGSPSLIRPHLSKSWLIENPENLGFAGGNNVGVRYLLEQGVDYVLLLNNDTEVAPDLLERLVEIAEADPRIGIVGPKIYYHKLGNVIWSAGGSVSKEGQPRHLRIDEPENTIEDSAADVDYVTGCAIMVKREVIERIGMLDERFFIYFEETEWCARAHHAGYRVVYAPRARVWHKIEPSARNSSPKYHYLMTRNRLLYLRLSGASPWLLAKVSFGMLRNALRCAVRPQHREMWPLARAMVKGVTDFMGGRFGAPPAFS